MAVGGFTSTAKFRSGLGIGITALTMLGATVAATGTASAKDFWTIEVINSTVPGGTNSVKVDANGKSRCTPIATGNANTVTQAQPQAPTTIDLYAFSSANCGGQQLRSIAYSFAVDDDVRETGKNCSNLALGLGTKGQHSWNSCR